MKHVLGTFEVEESEYASRFSKFENLQKILQRVAGMGRIGLVIFGFTLNDIVHLNAHHTLKHARGLYASIPGSFPTPACAAWMV